MDPKIVNILLLVIGFFLLITGSMQIMAVPGLMEVVSVILGVALILVAVLGLWKGKVI
jgi:uncharacterized membrane protein